MHPKLPTRGISCLSLRLNGNESGFHAGNVNIRPRVFHPAFARDQQGGGGGGGVHHEAVRQEGVRVKGLEAGVEQLPTGHTLRHR